ncbi:MAG TPA: protein phosphatase CheZ [Pseudolabrys sp.]|nr:protein phosphatase CheZ [Pseudolabrys sp.]
MQRKVFRIEQTFERRRASVIAPASPALMADDLSALRQLIAAQKQELAALVGTGAERNLVRAAGDLGAAIDGIDEAAHSVLKAAECIDADADLLNAALNGEGERALAQDIREQAARIFETCSFHDLAGQRIGKVIALLSTLEERLGAMAARCGGIEAAPHATSEPAADRGLINGPKLDGDSGHVNQDDVDKMFG